MKGSNLGRAAFSAVVALALGFGVREAVASPAASQARPYCEDFFDCEATCQAKYGPHAAGMCSDNLCFCYY